MAVKTTISRLGANSLATTRVTGIPKFWPVKELTDLSGEGHRLSTSVAGSVNALETTVCGKSDKFAILTTVAKMRTPMIDSGNIVARGKIGILSAGEV